MPVHETKACCCCKKMIECKVGNITQCQCYSISLTNEERAYLQQNYEDCLCVECLKVLKAELPMQAKLAGFTMLQNKHR